MRSLNNDLYQLKLTISSLYDTQTCAYNAAYVRWELKKLEVEVERVIRLIELELEKQSTDAIS